MFGNGRQNLEGDRVNLSQSKFVAADLTSSIVPPELRVPVSDRNPFFFSQIEILLQIAWLNTHPSDLTGRICTGGTFVTQHFPLVFPQQIRFQSLYWKNVRWALHTDMALNKWCEPPYWGFIWQHEPWWQCPISLLISGATGSVTIRRQDKNSTLFSSNSVCYRPDRLKVLHLFSIISNILATSVSMLLYDTQNWFLNV